jgi:hypothetical protein
MTAGGTISGSSGVIKLYGLLPIQFSMPIIGQWCDLDPLAVPSVPWLAAAGDSINCYTFGNTAAADVFMALSGVADY